jgi:hypothetical protein
MRKERKKDLGKENNKLVNGNFNKIELLSCGLERLKCKEHLKEINANFSDASILHNDKDYLRSIRFLKEAFYKASELKHESTCTKCSSLFRRTIAQSLQNMNQELYSMTHGMFKKKRYELSYIESCNVLNEFKKSDQ